MKKRFRSKICQILFLKADSNSPDITRSCTTLQAVKNSCTSSVMLFAACKCSFPAVAVGDCSPPPFFFEWLRLPFTFIESVELFLCITLCSRKRLKLRAIVLMLQLSSCTCFDTITMWTVPSSLKHSPLRCT